MENRVELLFRTGVINQQVADYIGSMQAQLQLEYAHKQACVDMLITHLAMAYQRISEGCLIEALSQQMMTELHGEHAYVQAQTLYQQLSRNAPCQLPDSEKEYVLLHLCSLLKESS